MLVRESISFKRGLNSKDTLGVGDPLLRVEPGDTIFWKSISRNGWKNYDYFSERVKDKIHKWGEDYFIDVDDFEVPYYAVYKIKKQNGHVIEIRPNIDESLSFEREKSSKSSLGVGI
jgi:hypothetical protein